MDMENMFVVSEVRGIPLSHTLQTSAMGPSELMQKSMEDIDQLFDPNLASLAAETW